MYKLGKEDPRYKEIHKRSHERRISFKGKRIQLKFNPRKGICIKCGNKGHTNLHHTQYDDTDPLKYTVELCVSCHSREHKFGQKY